MLKKIKGSTLILTLIFLLLTTIVSTSTFFDTFINGKKTSNYKASILAFEDAESALREGENTLSLLVQQPILTQPNKDTEKSTDEQVIYLLNSLEAVVNTTDLHWLQQPKAWWQRYGTEVPSVTDVGTPPNIVIEEKAFKRDSLSLSMDYATQTPGVVYYQISARSSGKNKSVSVLQSTFAKRFN